MTILTKMKHVAFEGIDGAGKTTQVDMQYSRLKEAQVPASVYRYSEKNNFWGRIIRTAYSLDSQSTLNYIFRPRAIQETLYALSARANLRSCKADSSKVFLSDRSIVTAYASHMNHLPEWFITLVEPRLTPDVVIYLDISPEIGLKRIGQRCERFRDEDLESLIEFRNLYMGIIFGRRPKRLKNTEFVIVDAKRSLEEVTSEVAKVVGRCTI